MAPSRRKGAGKVAAIAAARREWNVGDLVLAKVKGFPAWPATVSKPEKWGYPVDRKKVLVHFFGTQQIGFCNPVDVEEFTEERKVYLLGKRHGKGSDFVRAVNEIIDCFEKLKRQDQVSDADGTEVVSVNTKTNSDSSLTKSVKDEAPAIRVKPPATRPTNDLNSLTEAAVAAAAEDALLDEDMQLEETHSNLVFRETPEHAVYSSRSKTDVSQSQNSSVRRRISARRLRSSTRIDTNGLHNLKSPSMNKIRSSRRSGAVVSYDRSLRRSTRIKRLSDDSEGTDPDSVAFVSSESIDQHHSEDATLDSSMSSLNDGSTVESQCKPMVVDAFTLNNSGEIEPGGKLDFQTSTLVVQKKRRHNKKRPIDETILTDRLKLVVPEAEMLRTEHVSPGHSEKSAEKFSREDGDEHLPLVKRARARMGRPSAAREEEGIIVQMEKNLAEVPESIPMQASGPLHCNVDDPGDSESVTVEGGPVNLPLLPSSPAKKPLSPESGKKISVDGEAALPPIKRLHRALEAMSANVAEDSKKASKCLLKAYSPKGEQYTSIADWSEISAKDKTLMELKSAVEKKNQNEYSDSGVSEFCTGSNIKMPHIHSNFSVLQLDCVKVCGINKPNSEEHKGFNENIEGSVSKCPKMFALNDPLDELDNQNRVKSDLVKNGEEVAILACNRPCFISAADNCKIECTDLNETVKGFDPDVCLMNSECVSVEDLPFSSCNHDISVRIGDADGIGETENDSIPLTDSIRSGQRSRSVKEVIPVIEDSNHIPSTSPMKDLSVSSPFPPPQFHHHLSNSDSVPNNHLDDRVVSVILASSSLNDGPESVARGSPPCSSNGNISASAKNYNDGNSYGSSDIQLHSQKTDLSGKSSSKRETLLSFEAIIRSLTGTKESIGRATRIAIDCANFGFATKVVELLAQNLERETSSHRKVDLFFLVDSITQCSRSLKGDGGMYPSMIQALLPRLLSAAAPPGSTSLENHRQCLKVLRVWQERKIIPDSVIRRHIRELDAHCSSHLTVSSHRPLRNERAFDDPVREMEGMLVDEYGSNSSFQLPGFCMPPMLRDDDDDDGGSDSDGESFEAVTPEHNVQNLNGEKTVTPSVEKHSHILEDVDGELEMEDVAPSFQEVEINPAHIPARDYMHELQSIHDYGAPSTSCQQHKDVPLVNTSLPRSHLSPPPPLPPSGFPRAKLDSDSNGPNSNIYRSSQESCNNLPRPMMKHSVFPRIKPTTLDAVHHHSNNNRDFEAQVPRRLPDCNNACSFSDRPTSHFSAQDSYRNQPPDNTFSKSLHLRPPQPSPSNQFSYAQERVQSSRDIPPPPPHPNRFHMRNVENGNFFRDRDRNKFAQRDNIGERWRPPLPSISSPYHRNSSRMVHAPYSFNGPPYDPSVGNTRWNFPPRPMNQRHFNPRRSPEGPISIGNRGPNSWRPR